MTIKDIEAREQATTRMKEIAAQHQKESDEFVGAVGYPSCVACTANWPCDAAYLLAQLRDREEKLEAMQNGLCKLLDGDVSSFKGEIRHLLRILKGASDG